MNVTRRKLLASSAIASLALSSRSMADDWPQWRGLNRDGEWNEDGIVATLPTPTIPRKWSQPIGAGYSSPTVSQGVVLVTDRQAIPEQIERIHCFDELSGEPRWSHQYECPYSISYPAGPRAAVSVDNGVAFALGAMGHLHAIELDSGRIKWARDLNRELNIEMPIWGISASPLVIDGLVIAQVGGTPGACVIALDSITGTERWRALNDKAQYSAPVLIEQAKEKIVVVWTGESVTGLKLQNGEVAWQIPFPVVNMPIGVATPVIQGNRIFLTSFYDGSMLIEFDPAALAAKQLWHVRGQDEQHTSALHSIISTPVMDDEHIYGVDSYGQLRCLDVATGERIWEDLTATPQDRWSTIHFVKQNDRYWLLNEAGELIIAKLSPHGYEELSRSFLIKPTLEQLSRRGGKGVVWAHPAFANRCVYARNDEEIVCASLAADGA